MARMLGGAVDPRTEWEALEEALEGWGWRERVDLGAVAAVVAGQAREVLPHYDLELDLEEHLALVEAARQELARRALEALQEVHGQRREIDRLSQRINRDGMTQLLNHAFFQDLLAQEMGRCRRSRRPLALILADIDHFKAVNDTYGHLVGDRVIQAVADCLRGNLRQDDHIARYGGEEFAIVLLDTPPSRALEVGERLRRAVSAMRHRAGEKNVTITMSFGLALFRGEPETAPEDLLERADNALYRAKAEGRNRLRTYTATPD
jgi:diguanylate cyclase (GGDEF)-like protein